MTWTEQSDLNAFKSLKEHMKGKEEKMQIFLFNFYSLKFLTDHEQDVILKLMQ